MARRHQDDVRIGIPFISPFLVEIHRKLKNKKGRFVAEAAFFLRLTGMISRAPEWLGDLGLYIVWVETDVDDHPIIELAQLASSIHPSAPHGEDFAKS